ncbi:hypothetical protein LEM8419_03511 [Neolewinella maritima]|uniref:Mannosyl-glycoprotein endo-beta-N-acetylglucosamidase-like domain-containing protein n=1 Tax=Neolewinella maritima TaxID=1383882 RepID=A0ABM9B5G4_9BACT|nr:glucosaminidase domain-containing protein [Neolewinella maritima]CAH1002639.1 hypothetical protein LEM8419_03511 [Neolewinella maritima]
MDSTNNVYRSGTGLGFEVYRGERRVLASHLRWERIALLLTTLALCAMYYTYPVQDAEPRTNAVEAAALPLPPLRTDRVVETPVAAPKWNNDAERAYVKRFQATAIKEMELFGIPASISMAQGLLESGAGTSTLARKSRNNFGIKCFSKTCGKGHCTNHNDDHHKDFFRIYASDWESWRDHSKCLAEKDRYRSLFKLDPNDYERWAKGLSKAGYATDPNYPTKLIRLIERLRLFELDEGREVV